MSHLRQAIAFVLLAFWLTAAQHCDLEAAGFFADSHEDHTSASCKEVCELDACHNIEGISYTRAANASRLAMPLGSCVLRVIEIQLRPIVAELPPAFRADDPPQVSLLRHTWQFTSRSALPARAPDRLA